MLPNENEVFALVESQNAFPVDFNTAWEWLGYSRKDSAKESFIKSGFIAGTDFQISQVNLENSKAGRPQQIIVMTVDCFKMWAMMSGTTRGKEVRQYFLDCEKKLKERKLPLTYIDSLKALVASEEEKLVLQKQAETYLQRIEEDAPKVEFAEAIAVTNSCVPIGDFSKTLAVGRTTFFKWLRQEGIIQKSPSCLPYMSYCDLGYFEVEEVITEKAGIKFAARITGKGQLWLYKKWKAYLEKEALF